MNTLAEQGAHGGMVMIRTTWQVTFLTVLAALAAAPALGIAAERDDAAWTAEFSVDKAELSPTGRNPYFILEPGYQLVLEGGDERLVVTVLPETRVVDGVETRIVQEYESEGGQVVEISRNFYAISKRTGSVYYFGEEVDFYKNGKISSHEGTWLAGVKGAKMGLIMPGEPLLGARYYQEIAPDAAMDRAEVMSLTDTVKAPAGELKNCLKVEETTPLEPGVKEYKRYAHGIGMAQDGSVKLVKYGPGEAPAK
jgi:hypothetical protein